MRAIAEEAFAMVRDYKGSHSGEHGDGLVRSEFHEFMFGPRLVRAFEEVKARFDPERVFNPGKIVHAPHFDDRENFRYGPDYRGEEIETRLDWSAWPGAGGGFQGAVEMCNNNGACRKIGRRRDVPELSRHPRREGCHARARQYAAARGHRPAWHRALTSVEMAETMKLCVSCKACRRECPTGVDMARMKIEVQAARAKENGLSLRDMLVGYLPRYAPAAARRFAGCSMQRPGAGRGAIDGIDCRLRPRGGNCRNGAATCFRGSRCRAGRRAGGRAVRRHLQPLFRARKPPGRGHGADRRRLSRACREGAGAARPLCCGRTFLSVGAVDKRGRGDAAHARCALALHCPRRAGGGARAELHPRLPRRNPAA